MDDFVLTTPVAFLIFNRPNTTARVFAEIRRIRPGRLLVVADGPRPDRPGEAERCVATRAIVENVDWPCEVMRNYSDVNLGCKRRVSSGLAWVFEQVEEAIILEDDCLPHPSFFRFCQELLDTYRHDERIMMISGFNPYPVRDEVSYFFSRYPHIWGWSSWRRAWQHYDVEMNCWPQLRDAGAHRFFSHSLQESEFWEHYFDKVYRGEIDTWDAQVTFMFFRQNGLAVFPRENLIKNIGFGAEATHTRGADPFSQIEVAPAVFPLSSPASVMPNGQWDDSRRTSEYSVRQSSSKGFISRILNRYRHERNY